MRIIASVFAILLLVGCAGGKCYVTAQELRQPASLTSALFDSAGNVVIPDENQKVGHFSFQWRNWSMGWKHIPLSPPSRDISGLLAKEIEARDGNGIVNLKIAVTSDAHGIAASALPLIPGYITVSVEGDVVNVPSP